MWGLDVMETYRYGPDIPHRSIWDSGWQDGGESTVPSLTGTAMFWVIMLVI